MLFGVIMVVSCDWSDFIWEIGFKKVLQLLKLTTHAHSFLHHPKNLMAFSTCLGNWKPTVSATLPSLPGNSSSILIE